MKELLNQHDIKSLWTDIRKNASISGRVSIETTNVQRYIMIFQETLLLQDNFFLLEN